MCVSKLFQEIKDVPIYAKTIRELCIRKHGRKPKDPPTVHMIGQLNDFILAKVVTTKYMDPSSLIVDVYFNQIHTLDTLIDLGATVNVMTT